jgi:hypothetical protein
MLDDHTCDQVSPDELAGVLVHAEQVRQSNLPNLAGVGLQAWRGSEAKDDMLEQCRKQARALADVAFIHGAGAFWDGGYDDDDGDGGAVPMDAA